MTHRILRLLGPPGTFAVVLAVLVAVNGGGGAPSVARELDRPGTPDIDVAPNASTAQRIAATRAAIRQDPGDPALHVTLGDLSYQRGRETADAAWNERAHGAYSTALRLDPRNAAATAGLGTLDLAKHDFAGGLS